MTDSPKPASAEIRARLRHPVIDSDAHALEVAPLFQDYLKSVGGSRALESYKTAMFDSFADPRWAGFSIEERRDRRNLKPTWWANPARNTRDLATAMLPGLMYERMEEFGLDFSVVYPTLGLVTVEFEQAEVRCASARALNKMKADMFREFSDRLTPAALIPMHTPDEAIAELEYAVNELGLKVAMLASYVRRPIPKVAREFPGVGRAAYWMDTFGLDSEYDYDPVWAKCAELKISPTFHSVGYGWGARTSISNYVYNHIGNFAASAEAVCKALFLGGVPVRFPSLRFGFLEGGATWARTMYAELISHWEKRNREAIENYNPANVDRSLLARLIRSHGGSLLANDADKIAARFDMLRSVNSADLSQLDEWRQSGVQSAEDIRDIFTTRFFFGCEGDDPLTMLAFNPMGTAFNARLRAFYGSDIGHWDVPDMSQVLHEAYELAGRGLMTPEQLRDFVFTIPVEFWTTTNPGFFNATAVENQVNKLISESRAGL